MNILITGADRGLGFGMAKQLAEAGHRVFAGQYMPDWKELFELEKQQEGRILLIPLDVGSTESVGEARNLLQKECGQLDMLISNAGIYGTTPFETPMSVDYEHMLHMYNVNTVAAVRLVDAFYPLLKSGTTKRICFVSSEAGSITQAERVDTFAYCMSKAALNMYAKLLHNRLTPEGFDIRLYHPGWIRSYMSGSLAEEGDLTITEAAKSALGYFLGDGMESKAMSEEFYMHGYDGSHFKF